MNFDLAAKLFLFYTPYADTVSGAVNWFNWAQPKDYVYILFQIY